MNAIAPSISLTAIPNIPLIQPHDDLAAILLAAAHGAGFALQTGDILVITSKIVSKAEGRIIRLADVTPSADAHHYAELTGKDPRLVEVILRESKSVSRTASNGAIIVEHRLGFICANAGIDQSNLEGGDERVLLLPHNPDESAARLRQQIHALSGVEVAIVISDSQGRPFRMGNIGVAIGATGVPGLLDLRGQTDLFGRALKISMQGYGDLISSAAQLLSGEGAEGLPVVVLRGLNIPTPHGTAADLNRPAHQDLYR
ncbi:MAG: coenzyme F420-0:L-glutamate ligase [Phototrophicaceae bacterium]